MKSKSRDSRDYNPGVMNIATSMTYGAATWSTSNYYGPGTSAPRADPPIYRCEYCRSYGTALRCEFCGAPIQPFSGR